MRVVEKVSMKPHCTAQELIALCHSLRRRPPRTPLDVAVRQALSVARKNAGVRSLAYEITAEEVLEIVKSQGGVCAVSGLEFDLSIPQNQQRRPYFPSIDRMDNRIGYVSGNVRVVCIAVNLAMNVWGESVLMKIAQAMVQRRAA